MLRLRFCEGGLHDGFEQPGDVLAEGSNFAIGPSRELKPAQFGGRKLDIKNGNAPSASANRPEFSDLQC
jgi:hypothetical protein